MSVTVPNYDWTRIRSLKFELEAQDEEYYSYEELANQIGISVSTLKKLAFGTSKNPTVNTVDLIIGFFNEKLRDKKVNLKYFQIDDGETLEGNHKASPSFEPALSAM